MDGIDERGWSTVGAIPYTEHMYWSHRIVVRARAGIRWTLKESYDLVDAYTAGMPIKWLADHHERSTGGILSQLTDTRALAQAAEYMAGTKRLYPARKPPGTGKPWDKEAIKAMVRKKYWYKSHAKRAAIIRELVTKQKEQHHGS